MVPYKGWYFPESNGKGLPEEDWQKCLIHVALPTSTLPCRVKPCCAICHAGGWRHTIKAMTIAPTSYVVEHELK